jgi:FAD:protein FMN transferase
VKGTIGLTKQCVLILLLVGAILPFAAQEQLRLEQSMDAMGSTFSVVVYGERRETMLSAVDQAFEEVRRLEQMLSNYRPDSELSRVNREASERPVVVGEELFKLLAACVEYSRQSEGAFDITVGPLMKTWGFYKGSGRLPHRAEIRGILGRVGYQYMALDPQARTVRFLRAGMELDPGGIGKGYAVDRMLEPLKAAGIHAALISAGGSSIYALGAPPNAKGWTVSIRHPKDSSRSVEEVVLKDESLSTSGNYEKFFRAEGRIYSHIMDPRTGFPAQGMVEVSVITPKTLDSEAWTKPVYINGRDWSRKHLPRGFRAYLCEDKPGGNRSDQACAWLQ